jgi:hypothetical protein
MNIPNVPVERVLLIDGLPVMPLIPLILLKLQAWEDHRKALQSWQRAKQWVDSEDLGRLLPIAAHRKDNLKNEMWIPESFVRAAKVRLSLYLVLYGEQDQWRRIGLLPDSDARRIRRIVL